MIVNNDDIAEKTTVRSEMMQIDKMGISVEVYPTGSQCILDFKIIDSCVDAGNEIYIVFKNGVKVKYNNTCYSFNCRGQSATFIKFKKLFISEEIATIRVVTNNNYCQVELSEEQSKELLSTIQCAYARDWQSTVKYK